MQVNPFSYTLENGKMQHGFTTEADYNVALVAALVKAEIQVIAITDHWKARTAAGLRDAAEAAGISVFPGFEAATILGHHVLCLFNPGSDLERLEYLASELRGSSGPVPDGDTFDGVKTMDELVARVQCPDWGGICVAAHVTLKNGILKSDGEQSSKPWRCDHLYAAAIPGAIKGLLQGPSDIVYNKVPEYRRKRLMALLNAGDISGPDEVVKRGTSCNIKLAEFTVEGLRQVFLDPTPRIRLDGEPVPAGHMELLAAAWEGGKLDGLALHFNADLNVLIGGRGAGKSSIIETLRYAFEAPIAAKEARVNHESLVKGMLGAGGKVSVAVQRYTPSPVSYLIERTYPGPASVRDEQGDVLDVKPLDVLRQLPEIYGQHEIAEMANDRGKEGHLTNLLRRFLPARAADGEVRKSALQQALAETRERLLKLDKEISVADERLAGLQTLQLRQAEYEKADLPAKLDANARWQREGGLFQLTRDRLRPVQAAVEALRAAQTLDQDGLNEVALRGLPNADLLQALHQALRLAETVASEAAARVADALTTAQNQVTAVEQTWKPLRKAADEAMQVQLRALQADNVDGSDYLKLVKEIDKLQSVEKHRQALANERKAVDQRRRNLRSEYHDLLGNERRDLERTASQVTAKLNNRVRVRVTHAAPRTALQDLIRTALAANNPGGMKYAPILEALNNKDEISLVGLAEACRRNDVAALRQDFGLSPGQADQLANIGPEACMRLEELELPSTTDLELNKADNGAAEADWKPLRALSAGQRATAVLRLLLLESPVPLLIDQPEDDLDNRFIADDIVPIIKKEKKKRQFLFATHNANVPVLGDADLIVGLAYEHDHIEVDTSGALETPAVHRLVEKVLEGGKEAFASRRAKYNF
ncbi:hypothetical protein A0257_19435 [Hymenobacter psoromatis]|nr:hypothetical protein A0257_19435 [Hymenobacter psoromatis]